MSRIILHVGLPRTATTALQSVVFPAMEKHYYLGKNASNPLIGDEFKPVGELRMLIAAIRKGHVQAWDRLRTILPSVLTLVKIYNHDSKPEIVARSREMIQLWMAALREASRLLDDKPVVYSDESLVESVSGLMARPVRPDTVPLEQLHAEGFLEDVTVCVVLREPLEFLRASYYKTMEFRLKRGYKPLSFDEFLARQKVILDRAPSASRLFLGNPDAAREHFMRLCPKAVVTTYSQLAAAPHVLDTLLGESTGEKAVQLSSLPRENKSWRDEAVNGYVLSAAGVPAGLSIEQYAQTFSESLAGYSAAASARP